MSLHAHLTALFLSFLKDLGPLRVKRPRPILVVNEPRGRVFRLEWPNRKHAGGCVRLCTPPSPGVNRYVHLIELLLPFPRARGPPGARLPRPVLVVNGS